MVKGPPLKQHLTVTCVDLLHDTFHDESLATSNIIVSKIVGYRTENSHQCAFAVIDDVEFVLVGRRSSCSGLYSLDGCESVVENDPMSSRVPQQLVTLVHTQMIGAIVLANVKVMAGGWTTNTVAAPDEVLVLSVIIDMEN